jgi:hypothetical protein
MKLKNIFLIVKTDTNDVVPDYHAFDDYEEAKEFFKTMIRDCMLGGESLDDAALSYDITSKRLEKEIDKSITGAVKTSSWRNGYGDDFIEFVVL